MLEINGLKVLSYQYTIHYSKPSQFEDYHISDLLNQESKRFYLEMLNKWAKINHQYLDSNQKYQECNEKWFKNKDYIHKIYSKNNEIVGIVDYKNFDYDPNYNKSSSNYFDYNNKLCIRCLLSEEEQVLEDILKDLLNTYKKDVIINITYSEGILRNVVNKFDSKFDFCQYILVE